MPRSTDAQQLLAELRGQWGDPDDPRRRASAIAEALVTVREALPEVPQEAPVLADALVRALASNEDPWSAMGSVHWTQLSLAAHALHGSTPAQVEMDARYLGGLEPRLKRHLQRAADREEVGQIVREKVLLGGDRTLEYAARGALPTLISLIATRSAIDFHRKLRVRPDQSVTADAQLVDTLLDSGLTPELLAAKRRHQSTFKAAFATAIADLPAEDRGMLRLSLVQRLSVTEVAALQDVHRATAARRLAKVRDKLAETIRRTLRFSVGLSETELQSLHRALDSQLELSLSRLLTPEESGDE